MREAVQLTDLVADIAPLKVLILELQEFMLATLEDFYILCMNSRKYLIALRRQLADLFQSQVKDPIVDAGQTFKRLAAAIGQRN